MLPLEGRPESALFAKIARRCELCFRKAAVVVILLQRLAEVQIVSHSRFAAKTDFPAGLLDNDSKDCTQGAHDVVGIGYTLAMETRVELLELQTPKRAGELCRLIEKLHGEGCRVVVWVSDDGLRQVFDDFLWAFDDSTFIPHVLWTASMGDVEDPVVLVGEPANPNRGDELVVADEFPPEDWARSFAVVHDAIPPGEDGVERRAWWDRWMKSPQD